MHRNARPALAIPATRAFHCLFYLECWYLRCLMSALRWPHSEPNRIECGQKQKGEHGSYGRATDQRVGERTPEGGECQRDEREHRSQSGKNDRAGALHVGLHKRVERVETFFAIRLDLTDQDKRVAHEDAAQRNQTEDGVEPEGLMENQ